MSSHSNALPPAFHKLAFSNLMAQSAEQLTLAAVPIVAVPLTAASPLSLSPELVLQGPVAANELLPEESDVDTVFLDRVLDFLKSDEDPPPLAESSDSASSSSDTSDGEERPFLKTFQLPQRGESSRGAETAGGAAVVASDDDGHSFQTLQGFGPSRRWTIVSKRRKKAF